MNYVPLKQFSRQGNRNISDFPGEGTAPVTSQGWLGVTCEDPWNTASLQESRPHHPPCRFLLPPSSVSSACVPTPSSRARSSCRWATSPNSLVPSCQPPETLAQPPGCPNCPPPPKLRGLWLHTGCARCPVTSRTPCSFPRPFAQMFTPTEHVHPHRGSHVQGH